MKWIAIILVKGYQLILSPLLPSRCRFYPSCSQYTLEALASYGFFKGGYLSLKRIFKCHPFHPGGVDIVPRRDT